MLYRFKIINFQFPRIEGWHGRCSGDNEALTACSRTFWVPFTKCMRVIHYISFNLVDQTLSEKSKDSEVRRTVKNKFSFSFQPEVRRGQQRWRRLGGGWNSASTRIFLKIKYQQENHVKFIVKLYVKKRVTVLSSHFSYSFPPNPYSLFTSF